MKVLLMAVAGALLVTPMVGRSQTEQAAPNPQLVEAGKKLYASEGCAKCHQVDGQGSRMSILDGVGTKLTAEELKLWLTDTAEMMAKLPRRPAVRMPQAELEPAEVDALVAYLQTLKKN